MAATDEVVAAAARTQQANDVQQLAMITVTTATLAAAGITQRPGQLAADSGYWSIANLASIPGAPEPLIPWPATASPRKHGRPSQSRSDELRAAMRARLDRADGKARYELGLRTVGHRAWTGCWRLAFGSRTALRGGRSQKRLGAPRSRCPSTAASGGSRSAGWR